MQPATKDQNEMNAQDAAGMTPAAETIADDAPPASAAVDSAPPPAPGAIKCKEELKDEEDPHLQGFR